MKNDYSIKYLAFAIGLSVAGANTVFASAESQLPNKRITIHSAADLPVHQIPLTALPSKIVLGTEQELEVFNKAFTQYVNDFDIKYEFADVAAKRKFLKSKLLASMRNAHWSQAIELVNQMRILEDKPASKYVTGLLDLAYARAASKTGDEHSANFSIEYEKQLNKLLAKVDLSIARDELQSLLGFKKMMTADFIVGYMQSRFDETAKNANMSVTTEIAQQILIANRVVNRELPLNDIIISSIEKRLEEEPKVDAENLWSARTITVDKGETTLVAIWDSGMDIALQQGRVWTNPDPKAFNPHGLAFAEDFSLERENLMTRMASFNHRLNELQPLIKGFADLRDNKLTLAAKNFQSHVASLAPNEIGELQMTLGELMVFNHGQVVADIAAVDINPIELMNIKVSFVEDHVQTEVKVDEQYIEDFIKTAKDSVAFMQKHNVRVVNMSWEYKLTDMEQALLANGLETDASKAKLRAQEMYSKFKAGLTDAFASAPEILFVAAAGNSNENVEFAQSAPASINLPNIITVGAVDSALQPTSFTSFGDSIDFYANGFRVPGRMPGGLEMEATGTSMAAPLVTNLAAKILAVAPKLNPTQVVSLIKEHVTLEGEQNLPVVHPRATVCSIVPSLQTCEIQSVAKR